MENKDFDVVKEDMFDTIEEVIDITASEINIESKTVNEKIIEEDLEVKSNNKQQILKHFQLLLKQSMLN